MSYIAFWMGAMQGCDFKFFLSSEKQENTTWQFEYISIFSSNNMFSE